MKTIKKLKALLLFGVTMLFLGSVVSAHVVVKPGDVTTGAFQTFTLGVPNEKGGNVVMVKLLIPEGVESVRPNVKTGWTITLDKVGEGEDALVKSITWSGGAVGPDLRDEFLFSAKTPAEPTELQWKAYETYDSGVTVSWDKTAAEQPKKADGSPDFSMSGPFSVTKVAAMVDQSAAQSADTKSKSDNTARTLAVAGMAIGLISFTLVTRKRS